MLEDKILSIVKEIELNKRLPETMRKQIPILLFFIKTNASLEDMRKAINNLVKEKKILFFNGNDAQVRIMKSMNQNLPHQEPLLEKPTENELFVCGSVINYCE